MNKIIKLRLKGLHVGSGTSNLTYVSGEVIDETTIAITFTREVKASNAVTGVTVTVDAVNATVSAGVIQTNRRIIYYTLESPITRENVITWEYNTELGNITDLVDNPLSTVTAKVLTNDLPGALRGYYMGCLGLTYAN